MPDYISLEATRREVVGKQVKYLRSEGVTPFVIYSPEFGSEPFQAETKVLTRILGEAGGSQIIEINVDDKKIPVLAQEVQREPIKQGILHVDFYAVNMDRAVTAEVPLSFVGVSPIVEGSLGEMTTYINFVSIEALPADLPHQVEVDVTVLDELGKTLSVSDLMVSDKVTILTNADDPVVKVDYIQVAEEEEEEEEGIEDFLEEGVDVEVITERKADDEEEAE